MAEQVARKAKLELIYRGVDLGEHSVRAEYVDHAQGTLDELCLTLEDRDRRWQGPWWPGKGDTVVAGIQCFDWWQPGDRPRLSCGAFEISEVTLSGPPDKVDVRAASVKVKRNARTQRKSRAWEHTSLKAIAGDIAERAGMALMWDGADRVYERVDQREESDLAFLRRLCKDTGNELKLSQEKLIVYEGRSWDQRGPHGRLVRGEERIKSYRFASATHDLYRGCVVTYWHPKRKEHLKGEFFPPDAPQTGEVLRINKPVESLKEAQDLARHSLRKKNRWEVRADVTLVGDPRRRAAQVLALVGFGNFDGCYFVDEVHHSIDSRGGYETSLTMRRVVRY